jgi:hypothetical protein
MADRKENEEAPLVELTPQECEFVSGGSGYIAVADRDDSGFGMGSGD